ncbi:MAG: helix-turn-helix domain-containing protein [Verrucomicrobia bacterium]|nr:helix-turn-helix domain-containing protein [Verrucomicrobiota bacterium]
MVPLGEQLRRAREARGWSIHQVADTTKIRTDHVRALEEGNYDVFVAPVYIRGFVRTLASLLRLDVVEAVKTLEAELAATEKFREPPSLSGPPPGPLDWVTLQLSRVRWRLVLPVLGVGLLLLVGIWGVGAWRERQTRDPLAGLGPGLYQPAGQRSGETLPLPPLPPPGN